MLAGQYERIRVVEVDDAFLIEVNWCVCGAFAASLCGCWEIDFYLDDVDGVGTTNGRLPNSTRTVSVDSVKPVPGTNDDITKRCYNLQVTVPGNTVQPGAYSLLAIIKLYGGNCPPQRGTRPRGLPGICGDPGPGLRPRRVTFRPCRPTIPAGRQEPNADGV